MYPLYRQFGDDQGENWSCFSPFLNEGWKGLQTEKVEQRWGSREIGHILRGFIIKVRDYGVMDDQGTVHGSNNEHFD